MMISGGILAALLALYDLYVPLDDHAAIEFNMKESRIHTHLYCQGRQLVTNNVQLGIDFTTLALDM